VTAPVPRRLEEILEHVFTEREEGRDAPAAILAAATSEHAPDARATDLAELASAGLVRLEGDRDLLDLGERATEEQACEFEHILSREATESVCTLLGHPPTCPHGKPIPPGECCGAFQRTVRPLVTGLRTFDVGATGRIVFIAPKFHDRMDRLAALGVIPGSTVKLHQRSPSYVIEVGETTIALDPEIAGEIFVKPVEARSR